MSTQRLVFQIQMVSGILPLDLQTARDGDWVSMAQFDHAAVVFFKGAGTAGDNPVLTLEQATDTTGAGGKALTVIDTYHKKQGTLTAVGQFTKVTQTKASTISFDSNSGAQEGLYVTEFKAVELDTNNSYTCFRARIADTGTNPQLGCVLYLLDAPRDTTEQLRSAL